MQIRLKSVKNMRAPVVERCNKSQDPTSPKPVPSALSPPKKKKTERNILKILTS